MRTRKNIEELHGLPRPQGLYQGATLLEATILEVLLDIRDLLAEPGVQHDGGRAKDAIHAPEVKDEKV